MLKKSNCFRCAAAPVLAQVLIWQSVFVASAHGQGFTTIDYPGSIRTSASGIDGPNIVGTYRDSSFNSHSFLYDGTNWTSLDFPGGENTIARDASGDRIVGTYINGVTFRDESFIYDKRTWSALSHPAYHTTSAYGVDGNRIAGELSNGPGAGVGFIYNIDDDTWTTLAYPDSYSTRISGIDGPNFVGDYTDSSFKKHGFLYDGTNWTTLDFPGGSWTFPQAISGNNIVGSYTDPGGTTRGFRYDGRFWHTLGVPPGTTSSSNNGIDGQTILGEYTVGGVTHGFSTPVNNNLPTEYKFAFRGEVTSINDPGNHFDGAFQVGDTVNGRYNYFDERYQESVTANGSTSIFEYFFELGGTNFFGITPAPVSLELEIGDHKYTSGRNSTSAYDYMLRITNDDDGSTPPNQVGDRYHLQSQLQMPDHFQNADNAYFSTVFALYDESGTALSSTELPTSAPDVAKFASRIGSISLTPRDSFELLAQVVYRIDAIVAVPEPSCAALLCAAVVGLGSVRSRRFGLH